MDKVAYFTDQQVADILGVSKQTVKHCKDKSILHATDKQALYDIKQLPLFDAAKPLSDSIWEQEMGTVPLRPYRSIELFAGAGGLAIGLEQAGFEHVLLNELDSDACATLRQNRPHWHVVGGDIAAIDFTPYCGQIDLLSGGFPCQAFSYAGKKQGFADTRGTLFFEFARAAQQIQPKIWLAENVRGLLNHDRGRTLQTICATIEELGYTLIPPKILKAIFYQVPQKRERLFFVALRKDLAELAHFHWPTPYPRILTLKDALKAGILYKNDVPASEGQRYPTRKKEILAHVPPGGYWRDLPHHLQREYMKKSFFSGGGKTGIARRLSWDEPCLTLTCAPAQKQTERCHPDETRPLTIREYARIQTFPDQWQFHGTQSAQYRQIGNAVPVNLAAAVGRALVRLLNDIEQKV